MFDYIDKMFADHVDPLFIVARDYINILVYVLLFFAVVFLLFMFVELIHDLYLKRKYRKEACQEKIEKILQAMNGK